MTDKKLTFHFSDPVIIHDDPIDAARVVDQESRHIPAPGRFGAQYPRLLFLKDGRVLCVYTVYRNKGYLAEPDGGNALGIAESTDGMKTFHEICEIVDPGRDLDNGMMIERPDGGILLACRSVRWQESYWLPVYLSVDGGRSFKYLSMIDRNEGVPGELGNPDRGIYEPHMVFLDEKTLAVMYANERYALAPHGYSQIISEKLSYDFGASWGNDFAVCADDDKPDARPGMSVFIRMADGRYITVHEVVATEGADIFCKISEDCIHWEKGIGARIPDQNSGPFIEVLEGGALVVSSNTQQLSISLDNGESFYTHDPAPWADLAGEKTPLGYTLKPDRSLWPCLYALPGNRLACVTSLGREEGGNCIALRILTPVEAV